MDFTEEKGIALMTILNFRQKVDCWRI